MGGGDDIMSDNIRVVTREADTPPSSREDIDGRTRKVRDRAVARGTIYKIDRFVSELQDESLRNPDDWVKVLDGVYVHKTKSAAIRAPYDTWIGRSERNSFRAAKARVYATLIAPIPATGTFSYQGQSIPLGRLACAVWHGPCPDQHRMLKGGSNIIAPDSVCWAPIFEAISSPSGDPKPEFTVKSNGQASKWAAPVQHGEVVKGIGAELLSQPTQGGFQRLPAYRSYPFERMEVNDAFPVPKEKANHVSASAAFYVKKFAPNKHFVVRTSATDKKTYIVRAK